MNVDAEPVDPKVDFSDKKSLVANKSSRKTKIIVIGVLAVILLLGAAVSMAAFLALRKTSTPTRLTEINLEEGETLTYRVDQKLEVIEGKVLTGTITALVGLRVLNKTSEEYWFLMKINVTVNKGDLDMKGMQPKITGYFLLRLQILPRLDQASRVYGHPNTSKELTRYVHGIIDQLLPAVKRDLYEDVDGEKADSEQMKPEVPSLFPGAVKMHRQANTSDKNEVFIKNHFNRSDFVNMSATLDLDLEYSDSVAINKSNGMVKESHASLTEQLNFGTKIYTKRGFDVTMMKMKFSSDVSLVEPDFLFFDYAKERKSLNLRIFVKLVVPVANGNFTVIRKPQVALTPYNSSSNSSAQAIGKPARRRYRRSLLGDIWKIVKKNFKEAPIVFEYDLFDTYIVGINVEGKSKLWMEKKENRPLEMGVDVSLKFANVAELVLINLKYDGNQIEAGDTEPTVKKWSTDVNKEVWVWYFLLGVEFEMSLELQVKVNFPAEENKLVPCLFALEIEPEAKAVASIKGYDSILFLRAGVHGAGTLVDVSLPLKFSFRVDRNSGEKWGLTLSARMTALELEACLFYQWKRCQWYPTWSCQWGDIGVLYSFGKWHAFKVERELFAKYF